MQKHDIIYMRTLRSVYNQAVEEGLSKQSAPFKHVYTGVDKTSKRAISLNEIRKIKNLNLRDEPKLDFARDLFLFSFYMRGMSFIDIAYLKKTNLSDGYVTYNRKKTGQQITIKWEKKWKRLLINTPTKVIHICFLLLRGMMAQKGDNI